MYCSFCGKEIPDGSTFCGYCGKKLVYRGDVEDDGSYDGYGDEVYEGLEPVFVAPHWNTYRPDAEWDGEAPEEGEGPEAADGGSSDSADASDASLVEGAAADGEPSDGETAVAASEAVADGEAGEKPEGAEAAEPSEEGSGTDAPAGERGEGEASGESPDASSGDNGEGSEAAENPDAADADAAAASADAVADAAENGGAASTVRRVSKPISDKTYLKEVSANGVHVPSQVVLGETAPRKRVVPIGLVVVVVVAALLAGAGSAYAVFQYDAQNGGLIPGLSAPAPEPEPAPYQPAPDADEPDPAADELGTPDSLVAEDPTATDEPDPAAPAAVETGFSSAKKLIAALEKPLMDGLVANFSDATMRLLVIDELDFMYPPYALALANEGSAASLQAYSRTVVDEQARELGKYAGTWSFKLARGSKCSARTIERIQRQFQIMGVDVVIAKANKIEAVTGSYPPDYNGKNVDDEGLYHQVTSYVAVQIDGRWYLYTDALVTESKDEEE